MKFCSEVTCSECPWRKDVPTEKFPPERFELLANTVEGDDAIKPIFACHKSNDDEPCACVGYLMVEGLNRNIAVRLAAAKGKFIPRRLISLGPLFKSYDEMAHANGAKTSTAKP